MPNEQTSVPLFASGEVLTAANLNLSAGTGVPVFTNTTTRNAAFGGANEKVLSAGQLCYVSATNEVQYYNGSVWSALPTADTNGLKFISTTTASASSISLPANTFSSTYGNYRVVVRTTAASATALIAVKMRTSGTDNSTANYSFSAQQISYAGTAVQLRQVVGGTQWDLRQSTIAQPPVYVMDIVAPNLATPTYFTGSGIANDGTPNACSLVFGGQFNLTTVFDSMTFIPSLGTVDMNISVYGYQGI